MELKFVKGHLLTDLAKKSKISNEYARMLLTGKREHNSIRAKVFIAAAEALNEGVKEGTENSDKKLAEQDDSN